MLRFWLVVIAVCLIILAPSFVISYLTNADVPNYQVDAFPGDPEAAFNLVSGGQLERKLRFAEAYEKYQLAKKSHAKDIASTAEGAITRLTGKVARGWWEDMRPVLEFSVAARPVALVVACTALLLLLYTGWLADGVEVLPFETIGSQTGEKNNLRQALADQLQDVMLCFQKLPEELAWAGGDAALPSIPLPNMAGDLLTDTVASLGKIEAKGALGVSVELAKLFTRKQRYVLTGSISTEGNNSYALAWMIDRKSGQVVGRWEAHTNELTGDSPGVNSIVSLARILACKILFSNPAVPTNEPATRSWKTLYLFAESLRASRQSELDPSNSRALAAAAAPLKTIVEELGDDCNLVRFRRGQLYLLDGEVALAADQFEEFTERAEEDLAWHTRRVRERWEVIDAKRKSPLVRLIRRIPGVETREEAWDEITLCLEGGLLHRVADMYRRFPKILDRYLTALAEKKDVDSHGDFLKKHLEVLGTLANDFSVLRAYVEAVQKNDAASFEAAKQQLDRVFDPLAIANVYYGLENLATRADLPALQKGDTVNDPTVYLKEIEELKNLVPMSGLQTNLEKLRKLWSTKNWAEVATLMEQLRQWTHPIDLSGADRLIAELRPRFLSRVLLPGVVREFNELDRVRRSARSPLLLEALYYSAYARLQTFEPEALKAAYWRAWRLERQLSSSSTGFRKQQTRLAARALCLKITVAARLRYEGIEEAAASLEVTFCQYLDVLGKSDLVPLTADADSAIRADAYVADGLLKLVEDKDADRSAEQAALRFEMALRIRPRADTYVYLAECFIKDFQREKALELLKAAFKLSPDHPLARRRYAEWTAI